MQSEKLKKYLNSVAVSRGINPNEDASYLNDDLELCVSAILSDLITGSNIPEWLGFHIDPEHEILTLVDKSNLDSAPVRLPLD